ncbi:hypothetical protein OG206_12270 [Streptomyces sp. NBC_01341]|uniref:hypothetical protein n=1 Tax=Streptomyces sp. NBC_01341 TaxID=2903831 RepID=UPI002E155ACC|nr:hypothetical protein OG206_12270 [Streptomyces sp. NBC_01341]
MTGFGRQTKQDTAVLVLRDAREIAERLRRALATAPDAERPGLERALALAAEAEAVPDAELRARWVRQRLAAAGYEGPADSVAAIKALRRAEPGLSLLQAATYAREAAAA